MTWSSLYLSLAVFPFLLPIACALTNNVFVKMLHKVPLWILMESICIGSLMQLTPKHNGSPWRRVQNIVLGCLHHCELEIQVMIVFCTKLKGVRIPAFFFWFFFQVIFMKISTLIWCTWQINIQTCFPRKKSLTWEGQYISYTQAHGFRGKRPNPN